MTSLSSANTAWGCPARIGDGEAGGGVGVMGGGGGGDGEENKRTLTHSQSFFLQPFSETVEGIQLDSSRTSQGNDGVHCNDQDWRTEKGHHHRQLRRLCRHLSPSFPLSLTARCVSLLETIGCSVCL